MEDSIESRLLGGVHETPPLSTLYFGDVLGVYDLWPTPTCIISDGPYGLGKYPGEPSSTRELAGWYTPHIEAWARLASPQTTLWFWNSEIGWASVHPVLETHGWRYEECCTWNKGITHVAGNCNSKTIRGVPVVTEVAVRYTKKEVFKRIGSKEISTQEWLRSEWRRSGLPLHLANKACGVRNAATRKYLTACHLWYPPPAEAVLRMADYCQKHGNPTTLPYFSLENGSPLTAGQWERTRAKWRHTHGLTNVWDEPPVRGKERVRLDRKALHANQKPLVLMERQIQASTDPGDVVWEPFGGLCSASVAAIRLQRKAFAAEVVEEFFQAAARRIRSESQLNLTQS